MTYAFAARILPGQTEACRRFIAECLGPRRAELDDLQRRSGVTQEGYWLQRDPAGDQLIAVSSSDQRDFMAIMAAPRTDFDRWFRQQMESIFGFDLTQGADFPLNEPLGEWRSPSA